MSAFIMSVILLSISLSVYSSCQGCFDPRCFTSRIISELTKKKSTIIIYEQLYEQDATTLNAHITDGSHMMVYTHMEFHKFIGGYVEHMLEHGSLEDFHRNLNFILMCEAECVRNILKHVSKVDTEKGQNSLLRHFSTWLVISTDIPPSLNITLDNMALIKLEVSEVHSKAHGTLQNRSDVKQKIQPFTIQQYTLLWMPGKREWSRVFPCDLADHQLYLSLFPNTMRGLNGRKLILSTLEWEPFVKKQMTGDKVSYIGSGIDIAQLLKKRFNFSYVIVEPSDGEWGQDIGNWTWSGVIGMLQKQEADMCPTLFAMTYDRKQVVDFSVPVDATSLSVVYRRNDQNMSSWLYLLSCFSWPVYITGLAALLWSVLILVFINNQRKIGLGKYGSVFISLEVMVCATIRQGRIKGSRT